MAELWAKLPSLNDCEDGQEMEDAQKNQGPLGSGSRRSLSGCARLDRNLRCERYSLWPGWREGGRRPWIDGANSGEVIEDASFYRSTAGQYRQFHFALQHKNIAYVLKIITGDLFELY
jgi:hypothetical protein